VVHAQVPEAPDTYYQEVGRAGRDGEPAVGCLVYRPEDLSLGRFFSGGVPGKADVRRVLRAVEQVGDTDRRAVQESCGLGPRRTGRILNLLELVRAAPGAPKDLVAAVVERAEAQKRLERSRVEMMRTYAETTRCRTEWLQGYFGEEDRERCGECDNCRSGTAEVPSTDLDGPAVQTRVRHPEFGVGTVADREDDRITVLFEEVGYRTLALDVVEEQGLLDEVAEPGS
jgi:ATP-dependent DNA helicase RecQ